MRKRVPGPKTTQLEYPYLEKQGDDNALRRFTGEGGGRLSDVGFRLKSHPDADEGLTAGSWFVVPPATNSSTTGAPAVSNLTTACRTLPTTCLFCVYFTLPIMPDENSVAYEIPIQTKEQRLSRGPDVFFATPSTVDPLFTTPVIDKEVDTTHPTALHVVSGHFEGTDTTFNIYLPAKSVWKGRFFHHVYPLQPAEARPVDVLAATQAGGYHVQCKGTLGYRHEAATAQFSRQVASKYYGVTPESISGYVYGGSGGSYVTLGAIENSEGIWQGAVPIVVAVTMSIPDSQSIAALSTLVLADKLSVIADAVRPGGSGNPYETLNEMESAVLKEASEMGIPLRAWETFNGEHDSPLRLAIFVPYLRDLDPTYSDDFWTKDGYLGTEKSALGDFMRKHRHTGSALIEDVVTNDEGNVVSFKLPSIDPGLYLRGADFSIVSESGEVVAPAPGALDGASHTFTIQGGTLPASSITPTSRVQYDNSWFISCHAYHRYHQPKRSGYKAWEQYLDKATGKPIYPQRSGMDIGPFFSSRTCGGGTHTGDFKAKMIVIENLLDVDSFPWYADWYTQQVKENLGTEFDGQYRVWFNDNMDHYNGDLKPEVMGKRAKYDGVVYSALGYVAEWAENGIAPPHSTTYTVAGGQVSTAPSASDRKGIQPTTTLSVNGAARAQITTGETVTLEAYAEVPPGAGHVVSVDWDFTGEGEYTFSEVFTAPSTSAKATAKHSYTESGTYLPVVRFTARRVADGPEALAVVYNIGRARVVVSGAAGKSCTSL